MGVPTSKPIKKVDESAKALVIESLEGRETHGFDLDSVYFSPPMQGWVVLEFLRCESVRPFDSHPRRYWTRNWRKFSSLWAITRKLDGKLFLINYEDSREQFSVIEVFELETGEQGGILREHRQDGDAKMFRAWFQGLNEQAEEAWRYLGAKV